MSNKLFFWLGVLNVQSYQASISWVSSRARSQKGKPSKQWKLQILIKILFKLSNLEVRLKTFILEKSDFWKWMKLISPQKRKIAFWHKSVLDKQSRCRCRWLMTAILFSISYLPLSSVICHEWWSKSCFCSFTEFASRYRVTEREDQDHFGTVRHSRCAVRQTFKTEEIKTSSSSKVFSATVRWKNHRRTLALFVASIIRVAVLSWTIYIWTQRQIWPGMYEHHKSLESIVTKF